MFQKFLISVSAIAFVICSASSSAADGWEHPVWPYVPGSYDGRSFYYDGDHLGEDIDLAEGTAVRAIGDGIIKYYGPSSGYGELVVAIEHALGRQYVFKNAYGEIVETRQILSIYGHLRKSKNRGESGLNFQAGQFVKRGIVIGFVNNSSHPDDVAPDPNGHGLEHLHKGIRLSDTQTAVARDPSAWFRGYERDTRFGTGFTAASEALQILQHVGRYGDSRYPGSWRNDGSSQAFLNAYNRHDGPVKLGLPFDNGGSVYIHEWPDDDPIHNVLIQDYKNSDPETQYGTDGETALIYNRGINKAFLVKEGMWGLYKPPKADLLPKYEEYLHGLFGPHDLGAPTSEEHSEGSGDEILQTFDRGELRFSEYQNEWTILWYSDAPSPRRPAQAYRIIPQWEQVPELGFNALVSSTLIRDFFVRLTGSNGAAKAPDKGRYARPWANESIELTWELEAPPPNGTIDFLYSETGGTPFTNEIATGLQADTSGSISWIVPPTVEDKVWVQMIVKDSEGMIVESEISEFALVQPPTPTPTLTPTPTNTPLPPTPTNTATPKSAAPLSGTVCDISTGRPIANAILSIQGGRRVATNPQGEFEFDALSAGVYDITVTKSGYQSLTLTNVIIMPGQPTVLSVELTTPGLLNIETTSLPAAEVGVPYNPKVRVTGGTPQYIYMTASGRLPEGLTLDTSTGNISGTPSAAGSFTFAVGVRDKLGAYAEQQYTIVVTEPLAIQGDSRLPRATKGIEYFFSLEVSGGSSPYSFLGPEAPVSFPESPHPYQNHTWRTWTYSVPGNPDQIRVTFDARTKVESGYDYLHVRDAGGNDVSGSPFTGSQLGGETITVPGSKVIVTLRSDGRTTDWGFKITSISPIHPSGTLPPGLRLNDSGNLTGTPTQAGAYSFTIYVSDAEGRIAEKQFNIEIIEALTITTGRINDGIVGQAYNQQMEASGGSGRLLWEVYAGVLPRGLFLDSESGMLTGTPFEETYGTIVVAVSDEDGRIVYKDFTLVVSEPLSILRTPLPNALKDEPYSELIQSQGGREPYTYSMDGQLPDGLSLDTTTGIISGIPTVAQFKNFSITVTDSSYPTTQSSTQVLNMRVTSGLTITTSAVLPNAKEGVEISPVVLTAKGGPSPYEWKPVSGTLPSGITLNEESGELSGTPTTKGDYLFTLETTDSAGATAQKEFIWHVSDDLIIATTVVPDGAKDVDYKFALQADGGIPPYVWRLKSGTLPDGMEFNADGTITGKPLQRQTYSFTIEVNDSDSPAQTTQQPYIVQVLDTMFIATQSVPNSRVNEAYTATIRAQLGTPPYEWRLDSGVLPPGTEFISTPSVARIEGIPTEPGTYVFTIQVADSGTPVQTRTFEYTMQVYGKVEIETPQLKSALVGVPYSDQVLATGGQLPYIWRIIEGELPEGLQLNRSTGQISGITSLGIGQSSEFTVRVMDSAIPSGFNEKTFVIKVIEGIEIVSFTIPKAIEQVSYTTVLEGQGGISPYHWSLVSGQLPDGVTLDADTGEISGTPTEFGQFDFTVQMTDSSDPPFEDTRTFVWEVIENPAAGTPFPTPTRTETPLPGATATLTPTPTVTPETAATPTATPLKGNLTLAVVSQSRLEKSYGTDATAAFMDKLRRLLDHDTVRGEIVDLDVNTSLRNLYAEWDASTRLLPNATSNSRRQNILKANLVATAIKTILGNRREHVRNEAVKYVILVGSDRVIPHRRVPDISRPSHRESSLGTQLLDPAHPVDVAIREDYILVDDYYADASPKMYQIMDREFYLPDFEIGRLTETPQEMGAQVDSYLAHDGKIYFDRAFVAGSDVFSDGADRAKSILEADWGEVQRLPEEGVDSVEIADGLNQGNAVSVLGLHGDRSSIYRNGGESALTSKALDESVDSEKVRGSVVVNFGSHGGLNVDGKDDAEDKDLVQVFASKGVGAYVGTTARAGASNSSIAFTEDLTSRFVHALVSGKESATVGEAVREAKREYFINEHNGIIHSNLSDDEIRNNIGEDEKAVSCMTLYGLPMYTVTSNNAPGDPHLALGYGKESSPSESRIVRTVSRVQEKNSTPSVSPPGLGEMTENERTWYVFQPLFFSSPEDRGRCRRGLKSVSQTFCEPVRLGGGKETHASADESPRVEETKTQPPLNLPQSWGRKRTYTAQLNASRPSVSRPSVSRPSVSQPSVSQLKLNRFESGQIDPTADPMSVSLPKTGEGSGGVDSSILWAKPNAAGEGLLRSQRIELIDRQFLEQHETSSGTFYAFNGITQANVNEPVQPRAGYITGTEGFFPKGAVLEYAKYEVIENFDPVIEGSQWGAGQAREGTFDKQGFFPAIPFTVNTIAAQGGLPPLQRFVFVAGQYNDQTKQERLYQELRYSTYYTASESNETPPTVSDPSVVVQGDRVLINVEASDVDGDPLYRLVVLWTDGTGEWNAVDLEQASSNPLIWEGELSKVPGLEFFVQAVDTLGNVAYADNRGRYYRPLEGGDEFLAKSRFDESSIEEAGFVYNAATGFDAALISLGSVPAGPGTDSRGLIIQAQPGEGTLAVSTVPVPVGEGAVMLSVNVRADTEGCSAALAALNSPIDGQLGYSNASGADVPVGEWGEFFLIYDPPANALQPGVQVALPESAAGPVNVYFDNLIISELPEFEFEDVVLDVDGSFDGDTSGILKNVNGNSGSFVTLPDPAGGRNALLSILPSDDAANIGVFASRLQGGFPHLLEASVDAKLFDGSGGVTALVMTNGNGNVGVFVNNSDLRDKKRIMIGGGFAVENPAFPVFCVVQNGGPGVESSVVVDELEIRRVVGGL